MFGTRNGRLDACALDALEDPTQTMRVEERQMAFEMPIRVQYELLNGRITIMMYIYIYMIFNIYIYDIGYRFLVWVFCYFKATLCTCRRVFLSFRLSAQDWDPNFDGRVTLSEVNKCVEATRAMCALVLNLMSNWTCFGDANVEVDLFWWNGWGGFFPLLFVGFEKKEKERVPSFVCA